LTFEIGSFKNLWPYHTFSILLLKIENFVIIITLLLIDMGIRRVPAFHEGTGNILSLFVIYISLPALILIKIPELVISRNLLAPALLP